MAERLPAVSSEIKSVAYDPESMIFEVEYAGGKGCVCRYHHVPPELYAEFGKAYSIGTFVNSRLKPYFPCQRVSPARSRRARRRSDRPRRAGPRGRR